MDLFANTINKKCVRFYSKFCVPGSSGIDAFEQNWLNENSWAVPPFNLVGKFLEKFAENGSSSVLAVPKWPSAMFWPLLQKSSIYSKFIAEFFDVEDMQFHIKKGSQTASALSAPSYTLGFRFLKLQRN